MTILKMSFFPKYFGKYFGTIAKNPVAVSVGNSFLGFCGNCYYNFLGDCIDSIVSFNNIGMFTTFCQSLSTRDLLTLISSVSL